MPVYTYQAKDSTGQTVTGEVTAPDERTAAGQVRELGYYPMRVVSGGPVAASGIRQPHAQAASAGGAAGVSGSAVYDVLDSSSHAQYSGSITARNYGTPHVRPYGSWFQRKLIFPVWTGVSLRDLALFFRQFAAMLSAGMSIARALGSLQMQSTGQLRRIAAIMTRHIEAGGKLSEAMAIFPYVFTTLQRSIIEAAEETGSLDIMMSRISDYLEADYALRQMIKKETFLPKINFAATFLLPTLVILVMQGTHAYFQAAVLPLLLIIAKLGMAYIVGRLALSIREIAVVYDTIKAYLPYFGTTVRMLALAKFSRALSSLYASGVLIPRAVQTASRVTGNEFLGSAMRQAVGAMTAGAGLTESFERTGVFPPMFISMMRTGETTGNLDVVLTKVAEYYEDESALRLHQSVQALNTLIFLVVAFIVGRIVIQFWTGYYSALMNN